MLRALTCPGNPHDARTLAPQLDQVGRVTGIVPARAMSIAATAATRSAAPDSRSMSPTPAASPRRRSARELRRRSAIEPVIGHLKADGLLERNHLKGAEGDLVNALLCAIGHNLRLLLAWFRKLLWLLLVSRPDTAPSPPAPSRITHQAFFTAD